MKIKNKILSLFFALLLFVPVFFVGCGETETQSDSEMIVTAMINVADKMEETSKMFATAENNRQDSDTSTSTASVSTMSTDLTVSFEEISLVDVLDMQEDANQFIYAIEYFAKSTNKENGYNSGIEFDQVYCGITSDILLNGGTVLYIKLMKKDDGFIFYVDAENQLHGNNIQILLNFDITYDFETEEVKKISYNYHYFSGAIEYLVASYDYETNKFETLFFWGSSTEVGIANSETRTKIVEKYNSNTLQLSDLTEEERFYHIEMCSGNITDDVNLMNYIGYTSYDSVESKNAIAASAVFRGICNNTSDVKMRTIVIDRFNYTLINSANDAVTYGRNRSSVATYETKYKDYYYFEFVKYEEAIKLLDSIISEYEANYADKPAAHIDVVKAVKNSITIKGKNAYIGINRLEGNYDGTKFYVDCWASDIGVFEYKFRAGKSSETLLRVYVNAADNSLSSVSLP